MTTLNTPAQTFAAAPAAAAAAPAAPPAPLGEWLFGPWACFDHFKECGCG